MKNFLFGLILLVITCGLTRGQTANAAASDKATLEKQFGEKLSHSRFTGFFSIEGQEGPPKQDEYTLGAVEKGDGDKWVFHASIQFGAKVITVPLEIPVLWAGDTPVISVTNFGIPGMGKYTARVMIYGDQYAGTWSTAKHGGYMWGRIEKIPSTQPADGEKGK